MHLGSPEKLLQLKKFAKFDNLQHFSTILNSVQNIKIVKVEVINHFSESFVHNLLFKIDDDLIIFRSKGSLLVLQHFIEIARFAGDDSDVGPDLDRGAHFLLLTPVVLLEGRFTARVLLCVI